MSKCLPGRARVVVSRSLEELALEVSRCSVVGRFKMPASTVTPQRVSTVSRYICFVFILVVLKEGWVRRNPMYCTVLYCTANLHQA